MSFRVMTPPPQQKPQMASHISPSMSAYGRSPSLNSPTCTTDDIQAAKYARFAGGLHWLRIALNLVTLAASIAIIVCAALSLRAYSDSYSDAELLLPLWPLDVDLRPTHAVLGCGIVITILSLIYLAAAFAPLPHKRFCLNVTSSFLAFFSFVIALFAISYASIINNRGSSPSSGTLNSWTCQWQDFQSIAPANFTKICNEGSAAVDLVILLVVLEALALVLTAGGWMVEMRLKRAGGVRSGKSEVELV